VIEAIAPCSIHPSSSASRRRQWQPRCWYNLYFTGTKEGKLDLNGIAHSCLVASAFLVIGACSSDRGPAVEPRAGATTIFGDELALTGHSVGSKNGHTEVELRWNVLHNPSADYIAFVHALDGADGTVFQGDHWLKNDAGSRTGAWAAGDSVTDRFLMAPPANRSSGSYNLRIGLWDPKTPKFLQILQSSLPQPTDGWRGRVILIENVECK
jgi:hypothetical protein